LSTGSEVAQFLDLLSRAIDQGDFQVDTAIQAVRGAA
jgi:hypothetical protein